MRENLLINILLQLWANRLPIAPVSLQYQKEKDILRLMS